MGILTIYVHLFSHPATAICYLAHIAFVLFYYSGRPLTRPGSKEKERVGQTPHMLAHAANPPSSPPYYT